MCIKILGHDNENRLIDSACNMLNQGAGAVNQATNALNQIQQQSTQIAGTVQETGSIISKVAGTIGNCVNVLGWITGATEVVSSLGKMIWTQRRADRMAHECLQRGDKLLNRTIDLGDHRIGQGIQVIDRRLGQGIEASKEVGCELIGVIRDGEMKTVQVAREGVHGMLAITNKTALLGLALLTFGTLASVGLIAHIDHPVLGCVGMGTSVIGLVWIGTYCIQHLKDVSVLRRVTITQSQNADRTVFERAVDQKQVAISQCQTRILRQMEVLESLRY